MSRRGPFGAWLAAAALSSTGDSISFLALGWVAAAHGADAASLVLTVESPGSGGRWCWPARSSWRRLRRSRSHQ